MNRARVPFFVFFLILVTIMPGTVRAKETEKQFSFSLVFGPYRPDKIEAGGAGRGWEDLYGKDYELFSGIEWDWEVIQKYGIVSVGGGVGYVQADGHSLYSEASGYTQSPEELTFHIVPLSCNVTYRFSYLQNQVLVPFVRTGLATYFFQESKAGDTTVSGYRSGYHFAGGVAFLLDFLNPASAVSLDLDFGINNTFLVFEYRASVIDDFGKDLDFDFSEETWFGGILFEY